MDLNSYNLALEKYKNTEFVAVTLTGIKGSAPQKLGAKMIVGKAGLLWGTVGGGKIENHCIEVAKSLLTEQSPKAFTWNLQKDIGMTCGGEVSLLFEPNKVWNIVLMGAGHVSQALCHVLQRLECQVQVFDTRSEWLERLPQAENIKAYQREDLSKALDEIAANSFVCSLTMGHAHDVPILKRALAEFDFPYYGVIGSKSKRNAILKDLGLEHANFYCPIGEDFGSNGPSEIAISIASQLIRVKDQYLSNATLR